MSHTNFEADKQKTRETIAVNIGFGLDAHAKKKKKSQTGNIVTGPFINYLNWI